MIRLGYACINTELNKTGITTNRGMIKKTFMSKGLPAASQLALQNIRDLLTILRWNEKHGIKVFRMSSDIFPWSSEYEYEQLPNWDKLQFALKLAGDFAISNGHRLSFHPGQFNCMASENETVVKNSIKDLTSHGQFMDLLGMPRSHGAKINIHVGGAYGNREAAMLRFCKNFDKLPESVQTRLVVENDDKPNMFSTSILHAGIYSNIKAPITFDWHHYDCGPKDIPKQEALQLALSTWPSGIRPCVHHSSSRQIEEGITARRTAHADFLYEPFETSSDIDIMLECKAKEQGLFRYRDTFLL